MKKELAIIGSMVGFFLLFVLTLYSVTPPAEAGLLFFQRSVATTTYNALDVTTQVMLQAQQQNTDLLLKELKEINRQLFILNGKL